MFRRKQSFLGQTLLELFKRLREFADPFRRERIDIQLISAVAFIHRDSSARDNFHAVLRHKTQKLCTALKHNTFERRRAVLQRKIAVTRRIALKIRNLAADQNMLQRGFAFDK